MCPLSNNYKEELDIVAKFTNAQKQTIEHKREQVSFLCFLSLVDRHVNLYSEMMQVLARLSIKPMT